MTTLRVNEVYDRATIQGEGPHAGRVCTFVRLYGCNLHCTWCDTPYTWDTTGRNGVRFTVEDESHRWTLPEVVNAVVALRVPLCVVSGGEPMIQLDGLQQLASMLAGEGVATHVETNGTRPPPEHTAIEHFTVSPKLPSAGAGPVDKVLPAETMMAWAERDDTCFKVVVATPDEVHAAALLFDLWGVPPSRRWVMPQGSTQAGLQSALCAVIDAALQERLNVSNRLHVAVWGPQRGV